MAFETPRFRWQFLGPRFWGLWLLLAVAWIVIQLPYKWLLMFGRGLGRLVMRFGKRRAHIARTNLRLCFPEMSEAERQALMKANFEAMGIGVFEVAISWWWPKWRVYRLFSVEGLEHMEAIKGEGALILCMHFSTLDIGAGYLGSLFSIDAMYRKHKNPLFDWIQQRGRKRHSLTGDTIERKDVKGVIRALRKKHHVWYAPDQDYGPKQSVFAPFFDVPAATVTGTSRLARIGRARVIPCIQTRLSNGRGYVLKFSPALENFPTDDEVADATRINQLIEKEVRLQPEQYMWLHRRFKTRPPGVARRY